MAAASGKARPRALPSGAPGAGSPSSRTRASTMRTVADQAQFTVHMVFTRSSNTLGLRSRRPAPLHAHASRVSPAALA